MRVGNQISRKRNGPSPTKPPESEIALQELANACYAALPKHERTNESGGNSERNPCGQPYNRTAIASPRHSDRWSNDGQADHDNNKALRQHLTRHKLSHGSGERKWLVLQAH
jgi:hypothetical protein